ncbi:MAG: pilus assembly protein PilZ [Dehalococcoidia bacterium]
MKETIKRIIRDEKGRAMELVLILLTVGGLILTPMLGLMSTGLLAGQVYETKTDELYAADAGVEDAIWKINDQVEELPGPPCGGGDPESWSYNMSDVNGKSVSVTITYVTNLTYQVESIATAEGSGTQVEAYVTRTIITADYSGIGDNVITSPCDYTLQGPSQVNPPEGEEHGPVGNYTGDWPTPEVLSDAYWEDVEDEIPYNLAILDVKDYPAGFGPLYRDGTLDIINSGTAGLTVTLNGTIYITGETLIGMTNQDFTLDLNGQTIFVEDDTGAAPEDDLCNPAENQYALRIGTKCTLTGSGCVIAVGGIEFKPNLDCTPTDYIFVLSVRGVTHMQPNGDFYGTLAGLAEVYIQNGTANWVDPSGGGLNFPYVAGIGSLCSIATWEVNPA